jgi:hypothetical protein
MESEWRAKVVFADAPNVKGETPVKNTQRRLVTFCLALLCVVIWLPNRAYAQTPTPQPIFPKYKVMGVVYAPPGSQSNVTYGSSKLVGSSDSISTTNSSQTVNTTSFEVGATLGVFGASIQYNQSDEWGTSLENSNSVAVQTQMGNAISTLGPISSALGVDHDNDIIYIWLNPVESVSTQSSTVFNWTNISSNGCDLTDSSDAITFYQAISGCDSNQYPFPDIVGIPVWCLKNPYWPGQGCAQWLVYTKRSWDLSAWGTNSNGSPILPGLNLQDYADILQADPFVALNGNAMNVCHPTYGVNIDPNDTEYIEPLPVNPSTYGKHDFAGTPNNCIPYTQGNAVVMSRFQPYGTVEYPEPGPNGQPVTYTGTFQYNQTQTQGTIATDTHTIATSWDTTASFGDSFGPVSFDAALSVGGSNSTTWMNQSNTSSTSGSTSYANYSITGPQLSDNYNGPATFNVYLDNVYGTYAFYSDLEPQFTLGIIGINLGGNPCPQSYSAPPSFTFSQVTVGGTSTSQPVTLTNCSVYPLTMVGPAVTFSDPGFAIANDGNDRCSNQLLQPLGTCSLNIIFAPVFSDAPNTIYGATDPVSATLIAAGTESASSYQNILVTAQAPVAGTAAPAAGIIVETGTLYPSPIQNPASGSIPQSENVFSFTVAGDISNYQTAFTQKFTFTNYSCCNAVYFGSGNPYLLLTDANDFSYITGGSPPADTCFDEALTPTQSCYITVSFLPTTTAPPSGVYGTRITMMGSLSQPTGANAVPVAIAGASGTAQNILTMSPSPFSGSLSNPPAGYNFFEALTIKNNSTIYSVNNLAASASQNTWALILNGGSFGGQTANCPINGASLTPGNSCIALVEAANLGQTGSQSGSVSVTGTLLISGNGNVNPTATDLGTYSQTGNLVDEITVTGAEQSTTEVVPATYAKGKITVSALRVPAVGDGSLSIGVGGFTATASYSSGASVRVAAKAIAQALNVEGSPVTAKTSGSAVTLTSAVAGSAGNIALEPSGDENFELLDSGATLTGGKDATTKTEYDGGTVDVTTAGVTAWADWGSKSTPQSIAQALATSINKLASTYWKASVSGDVITLTSVSQTPPSIGVMVTDSKGFTPPSFGANLN